MQQEFNFTDEQYKQFQLKELYQYATDYSFGIMSIYYIIDEFGDYKKSKIATTIFNNLSAKEQLQVLDYMEGDYEDGDQD